MMVHAFCDWTSIEEPSIAGMISVCALLSIIITLFLRFTHEHLYTYGVQLWPLVQKIPQDINKCVRFLFDLLLGRFQSQKAAAKPRQISVNPVFSCADTQRILPNFASYPKSYYESLYEEVAGSLCDGDIYIDGYTALSQPKKTSPEIGSLASVSNLSPVTPVKREHASKFSLQEVHVDAQLQGSPSTFQAHGCRLASPFVQASIQKVNVDAQINLPNSTVPEHTRKLAGPYARSSLQEVHVDTQDLGTIGKPGKWVEINRTLPERFPLPNNDFASAFDHANEILTSRLVDPFKRLSSYIKRGVDFQARISEHVVTIEKFIYGVIYQRKQEYKNSRCLGTAGYLKPQEDDIIYQYLALNRSGEHAQMSDRMLKQLVLNFVIAGRETTAVTKFWLVYILTEYRDTAHSLLEELLSRDEDHNTVAISQIRNEESSVLLKDESPEQLPHSQAITSETVWLHPAVLPAGGNFINLGKESKTDYLERIIPTDFDSSKIATEKWVNVQEIISEADSQLATFQSGNRTCVRKDSIFIQKKPVTAALGRVPPSKKTVSNGKITGLRRPSFRRNTFSGHMVSKWGLTPMNSPWMMSSKHW